MTNAECLKRLEKIAYTAGINQRYHQQFQWWWSIADKAVRIAVGILAVIGVFVLTPGRESWAAVVAFLALIAAIVLNIIPSAEREQFYGDLFRRWSDLRKDAESENLRLAARDSEANATPDVVERIRDLCEKEHCLCAAEPAPWRKFLGKCQEDENQSRHGLPHPRRNRGRTKITIGNYFCGLFSGSIAGNGSGIG